MRQQYSRFGPGAARVKLICLSVSRRRGGPSTKRGGPDVRYTISIEKYENASRLKGPVLLF